MHGQNHIKFVNISFQIPISNDFMLSPKDIQKKEQLRNNEDNYGIHAQISSDYFFKMPFVVHMSKFNNIIKIYITFL